MARPKLLITEKEAAEAMSELETIKDRALVKRLSAVIEYASHSAQEVARIFGNGFFPVKTLAEKSSLDIETPLFGNTCELKSFTMLFSIRSRRSMKQLLKLSPHRQQNVSKRVAHVHIYEISFRKAHQMIEF